MEIVGVIAFAFGQNGEKQYPISGPSNRMVAKIAHDICAFERKSHNIPLLAVQWETSILGAADVRVSQLGTDTHYIDTKKVLGDSVAFFKQHNVERVGLVAHPLHLFCITLLIQSGT